VAIDRHDRVFVFNRGAHPVMVFDANGTFVGSWGEGAIVRAHGITIAPDDTIYCTDDADHTVKQFTPEGKLLRTLGTSGQPSDTGATSVDFRTIRRAAGPFHFPTNVAFAASGDIYIADGYGNARIHRFSPDGRLLQSWGEPGSGPGQFHIPHGLAVSPDGSIYVADRENSRIQIFDPRGQYLGVWTDVVRPCQITFHGDLAYVAELGYRAGMWPGALPPSPDAPGGRLSIFNLQGQLQSRWGGGLNPTAPGDFFAPHDIAVDSAGAIYLAEVTMSAGGNRGLVPPDSHNLQKFTPVAKSRP